MKKLAIWVLGAVILVAIINLALLITAPKGMNLQNVDAFIQALESKGYKVYQSDIAAEDNKDFGVPRQTILTDKAIFRVYEFGSIDEAKLAASYIAPNGSSIKKPNQSLYISWAGHPHYYRSGKLIALYVGRNIKILTNLNEIMGRQTAGSKWYELVLPRGGK